jgi:hypothetical protein
MVEARQECQGGRWHVLRGSGFAEVWPLIEEWGLQLELPGRSTPPFTVREHDESCTEAELDLMVQAVGPLGFDVSWEGALRGLPSSKRPV